MRSMLHGLSDEKEKALHPYHAGTIDINLYFSDVVGFNMVR